MLVSSARRVVASALCMALVLLLALPLAQAAAPASMRVAILPFTANAKDDISFLVKGVRDMLATRLAWQDKVTVVEPDLVAPVLNKIKPPYNDDTARRVGKELSAQVVVFGSITALGKSVSVDARVVKVDDNSPALTAFVQAAEMDLVIPRINDFAQRINAEIFRRPEAVAAQEKAQAQAQAQPAAGGDQAEVGGSGLEKLPENISPLNPLFMRTLAGVDSDRYWRSPRLKGTVQSVAVADVDMDGKNELLALFTDRLEMFRLDGDRFVKVREFKNGPTGEYFFVDVADIAGTGRPHIFVSCLNNKSINSFILQYDKGFRMVAEGVPYYFRVQRNPVGPGQVLGQKAAVDEPFFGPIYQMKYQGGEYVPDHELKLPEMANVFNFCLADLNGSKEPMVVLVGPSYSLRIFNSRGEQVWMSAEAYCASNKYIPFMASSRGPEPEWWYIPARLVVTDLDKDGRQEILAVRNSDRAEGIMERTRMFYKGTIYGLSWNGLGLVEDWRTPNMSGYLPDYIMADVGNVGREALVLTISQMQMSGLVEKGTSNIVAFTLKTRKKVPVPENRGLR